MYVFERMKSEIVSSVSARRRVNHYSSVMKRIIRWLEAISSGATAPVVADQSSNAVSVYDLVTPDIYADEHVATVPDLKPLVPSSPGIDKSAGFNPYDTGVYQKKKRSATTRS